MREGNCNVFEGKCSGCSWRHESSLAIEQIWKGAMRVSARADARAGTYPEMSRAARRSVDDRRSLAAREDHPSPSRGFPSGHSNITPGHYAQPAHRSALRRSPSRAVADRSHNLRSCSSARAARRARCKVRRAAAKLFVPRPPADAAQFNTCMNARVAMRSPSTRRPQGLPL